MPSYGSLATNFLVFAVSGLAWLGTVLAEGWILPNISYSATDLLLLAPALRLLLLLIGGVWAALGISIASAILLGGASGEAALGHVLLLAVTSGFAPYVSLLAATRLLGVADNLDNLSYRHLPFISLGVAAGSSALHAVALWFSGSQPLSQVPSLALAMASVDFLGCLVTILLLTIGLRLFRHRQRPGI